MTTNELEFLGSEYDNGYAFGSQGRALVDALITITTELSRPLTAHERQQFDSGWAQGNADHAAWQADQSDALSRDVALAVVWTGIPF